MACTVNSLNWRYNGNNYQEFCCITPCHVFVWKFTLHGIAVLNLPDNLSESFVECCDLKLGYMT